jgi:hypothetical protein
VSKIQNLETSLAKPELLNCCTEIDDEPHFLGLALLVAGETEAAGDETPELALLGCRRA